MSTYFDGITFSIAGHIRNGVYIKEKFLPYRKFPEG